MPTPQQATDTVYGAFNTAWSTNPTYPIIWPNKTPETDPTKQANPWAFVRTAHKSGRETSLAGVDGKKMWERKAQFFCEIRAPSGEGTQKAYALAKLVESVFASKTLDSVRFRSIQIKEGGIHGNWFLITVTVDFEYDEIV